MNTTHNKNQKFQNDLLNKQIQDFTVKPAPDYTEWRMREDLICELDDRFGNDWGEAEAVIVASELSVSQKADYLSVI